MHCWGKLKSLRAQSVGEVSAYTSHACAQFSRYVEMKSARPTKAGYAPERDAKREW